MPDRSAPFGARVVAFTLDIALATAGYFASLKACFPREAVWGSRHGPLFALLWSGVFLLYQAFMSCEGRRSLGKAALGLRVTDADGEPLELGRAALRSAAYLVSSLGNLGFAWALVDGRGRAWHDLIARTVVTEDEPSSPARRRWLGAAATACIAGFIGLWYWRHIVIPRYERLYMTSAAQASLEEMKVMERLYFYGNGRFTASLDDLGIVSGDPAGFKAGLPLLLDMRYGVSITTTPVSYRIDARARNDERTPVSVRWP